MAETTTLSSFRVTHRTLDATLRAIILGMAELHRMSTFAIVACNIVRNVSGVEASSTSAAFYATIALCVCSCNIARNGVT